MTEPIEIFVSYSHKDEDLCNKLLEHLSILKRQGSITTWFDRDISAGSEWQPAIDTHLSTAQIILLLISPAFIASDYCYGREMTQAMEKHKAGKARVIPIILRPVLWESAPFGKLQALPTNAEPIISPHWYSLDEAFLDVTMGIQRVLEELSTLYQQESRIAVGTKEILRRAAPLSDIDEHLMTYRQALLRDPRLIYLQILDMRCPLELMNVYVRVRLHQEPRLTYKLDSTLTTAESRLDPNVLLDISQQNFQHWSSNAIDPEDAILRYKYCVFVGDPGAGKTTLLKYLLMKSANDQLVNLPNFPVHIELNVFARSGHARLLDFASEKWEEYYGIQKEQAQVYLEKKMIEGNVLLLLDALDETAIGETIEAAEESYIRISNAITQLMTQYPQNIIVVTARKAGYQQHAPLIGFTELELLEFRSEDILQFITNWFQYYHPLQKTASALDLQMKLKQNQRIYGLAANPLLLSLIVLVYQADLDLPKRRVDLYQRCLTTLFKEWDMKRRSYRRRRFTIEHKSQLLKEIAWHFHNQGKRYFPENELRTVITQFLKKVGLSTEMYNLILEEISNEHGFLKMQAYNWYGFFHLTLQEYFAALYASENIDPETLLTHRGDPWWEEVFLLYSGLLPDASTLLQILLDDASLQEDIFDTNYVLAGRCLATQPIIRQITLREKVVSGLFDKLVKNFPLQEEQISEALVEIGGADVENRLFNLLFDEQIGVSVRSNIVRAFGKFGRRSALPHILRLLDKEVKEKYAEEHKLRASCVVALGMLEERSVVPKLINLLQDEQENYRVHESIVLALKTLGDPSIISDLLNVYFRDPHMFIGRRKEIANTICTLSDEATTYKLVQILTDKSYDSTGRELIAEAFGETSKQSTFPDLLRLLMDNQEDYYVRQGCAYALGDLGNIAALPDLLKILANKKESEGVRFAAISALSSLGNSSVAPDLLQQIVDKQNFYQVREECAIALGHIDQPSIIPDLLLLFNQEQIEDVRCGIAFALGMLGERSIIPKLTEIVSTVEKYYADGEMYEDEDRVNWRLTRRRALKALYKLGDASVVPALLKLIYNPEDILREDIVAVLEHLVDDEETIETLFNLLTTTGPKIDTYVSAIQFGPITQSIQRSLWAIARRKGIRILAGKQLGKIDPW